MVQAFVSHIFADNSYEVLGDHCQARRGTGISSKSGDGHSDMVINFENFFLEASEFGLGLLESTEDLEGVSER